MDEQLKHRLVGAAVIVVLAVLVVPMFFEDKTPKDPATLPDAMQEKVLELPADDRDTPEESAKPQEPAEPTTKTQVKTQKYEVVSLDETPPRKPPKTGTPPSPDSATPNPYAPESPVESGAMPDDNIGVDRPSPRMAQPLPATRQKANMGAAQGDPSDVRGVSGSRYKLKSTTDAAPVPKSVSVAPRKNTPAAAVSKPGTVASPAPNDRNTASPSSRSSDLTSKKTTVPPTSNSVKAAKKPNTPLPGATPNKSQPSSASGGRWTVQAGTFADEANARKLVEKLQKRNLPVRIHATEGGSGKVYRVTVGPSLDRNRAEQIQKQLSSQDGVKGMILQSR